MAGDSERQLEQREMMSQVDVSKFPNTLTDRQRARNQPEAQLCIWSYIYVQNIYSCTFKAKLDLLCSISSASRGSLFHIFCVLHHLTLQIADFQRGTRLLWRLLSENFYIFVTVGQTDGAFGRVPGPVLPLRRQWLRHARRWASLQE